MPSLLPAPRTACQALRWRRPGAPVAPVVAPVPLTAAAALAVPVAVPPLAPAVAVTLAVPVPVALPAFAVTPAIAIPVPLALFAGVSAALPRPDVTHKPYVDDHATGMRMAKACDHHHTVLCDAGIKRSMHHEGKLTTTIKVSLRTLLL